MKTFVVLALMTIVSALATQTAAAASCTSARQACLAYCNKNVARTAGTSNFMARCTESCASGASQCMQSGCFVTNLTNKCGYTKS
jgi:hypothetical protein